MANETEQLVVQLEARIRDFERNMQKARAMATANFGQIHQQSVVTARRMQTDWARSSSIIGNSLRGLNAQMIVTRANMTMMMSALAPGRWAGVGAMALAGGPAGWIVAGLTAATSAAAYFWQTTNDGASKAETALREHDRLLGDIRGSYNEVAKQASAFYQQRRAILLLEAKANVTARREAMQQAISNRDVGVVQATPGLFATAQSRSQLLEVTSGLSRALSDLRSSGNVAAYIDAIGKIRAAAAQTSPELATLTDQALKNSKGVLESAEALERAEAALRVLHGTETAADRGILGITTTKATTERLNEYQRATRAVTERTEELKRQAGVVGATTFEQARSRAVLELTTAAQRASIEIDKEKRAEIEKLARAYASQTAHLERVGATLDDVRARHEAFGQMAASAFEDLIINGAKFTDVLEGIRKSIMRMALEAALLGKGPLGSLFGAQSTGGGVGGLIGALIRGFSTGGGGMFGGMTAPAGFWHEGGKVGEAVRSKQMSVASFIGAPRLHNGLSSDEFRAILKRGEHVLTQQEASRTATTVAGLAARSGANLSGGGALNIKVDVTEAPGHTAAARQREDGSLEIKIERMVEGVAAKSIYSNGPVSKAISQTFGLSRHSAR